MQKIKRSLAKRISRLSATCFGCGKPVDNEDEVCDACNRGSE